MKKKLLLIFLVAVFSFLQAIDEPVAVTLKLKGSVKLSGQNNKLLENSDLLYNKDKLVSENDSFAALRFVDGSSIVKLFPNSELVINAESKGTKLIKKTFLSKGKLLSKIEKKMGGYQVETPTVVASVKGTEFIVNVNDDGTTTISTISGVVEMKNKKDNKRVLLGKNEQATSGGSGTISIIPFVPTPDDDLDKVETIKINLKNSNNDSKEVLINIK